MKKFEPGNEIMVDHGFLTRDLLPDGVTLAMPSFMEGRPQLPDKEEVTSRQIASTRVHVERAIRRMKVWWILSYIFPLN